MAGECYSDCDAYESDRGWQGGSCDLFMLAAVFAIKPSYFKKWWRVWNKYLLIIIRCKLNSICFVLFD